MIDLHAAMLEVSTMGADLADAQAEQAKMIAECKASGAAVPPNYWQTEYHARRRYEAACAVYAALAELAT